MERAVRVDAAGGVMSLSNEVQHVTSMLGKVRHETV